MGGGEATQFFLAPKFPDLPKNIRAFLKKLLKRTCIRHIVQYHGTREHD